MENKCLQCGKQLRLDAKFCTSCGAKVFVGADSKPTVFGNICECGAQLKSGAKFCTICGKKVQPIVESLAKNENTCECGAQMKTGSKFCTKCGKKTGQLVLASDVNLCSCGINLPASAKFCTHCGQKIGTQVVAKKVAIKKSKRLRNRILASAAVIVLLLASAYFVFIYNPGIKKTLLASYEILPNDSTETVISYNDEVTIKIPPGGIKERDSLHLYSVENIDAPEFADDVLRTYDFDFAKTETFSSDVEVVFSYKNDLASNNLSTNQAVHVMYYNEETEGWENTDALIDKGNNSIRVFRSHFSSLGLVSHSSVSGPMMQVYAMVDPATVNYIPEYSAAQDVVQNYSENKKPDQEAIEDGVDFFLNSFDIASLATDIHEQLFKFERFSKFNQLAGQVSIIRSAISLGIELGQERYLDAIVNVTKNVVSIGAAAAGFKFIVIYNVAVFLYDLYSDKLDAEAQETEMNNYMADYNHYNASENPFRKSTKDWAKYINDHIETSIDCEWQLQQEVKKYVEAFFEKNTNIPQNIKESIINHESIRMRDVIKEAMILYVKEIKEKQEREMIQYLFDMKKEMNSVITIQVCVYGEKEGSKAVRGLPVKIVVDKDQELWSGATDRAGQFIFNCTWLGYLTYGCPQNVEAIYDDVAYSGKISIDRSNMAIVRIYINEKQEENTSEEEKFNMGILEGTYHGVCYKFEYQDISGNWITQEENFANYADNPEDHSVNIVVEKSGKVKATFLHSSYCNPKLTGEGFFKLNDQNIPVAEFPLVYSQDCDDILGLDAKYDEIVQNEEYSVILEFKDGSISAKTIHKALFVGKPTESNNYYSTKRK